MSRCASGGSDPGSRALKGSNALRSWDARASNSPIRACPKCAQTGFDRTMIPGQDFRTPRSNRRRSVRLVPRRTHTVHHTSVIAPAVRPSAGTQHISRLLPYPLPTETRSRSSDKPATMPRVAAARRLLSPTRTSQSPENQILTSH